MQPDPKRPWWREAGVVIALLIIVYFAHFHRLDALTLRGEEPRRTAIGLEMLQSGDWLVPRIQGEPVFFRPPLQNWLIGLSVALFGETNHWTVRLPGTLATLLTCLVIYVYSRHFLNSLGAFSAAVVFATFAQVLELGHLAETESLFIFLVALTLFTWHAGYMRGWPAPRLWITAYALAAVAALAKGMQAPVYLFASSGALLILTGQWRRFACPAHLLGLVTFAVIFGTWLLPYALTMGWSNTVLIVSGETTMRLHYHDTALVFSHLLGFPLRTLAVLLPWSLLLFAYVPRAFWAIIGDARPLVHFCGLAVLVTFPTCWFVPHAVPRHWMSLYPCIAPLIGLVLQRCAEALPGSILHVRWQRVLTVSGCVVLVTALFFLVTKALNIRWAVVAGQPFAELIVYCLVGGFVGIWILARRRRPEAVPDILFAFGFFLALNGSIIHRNFALARSNDFGEPLARFQRQMADSELYSLGLANARFALYYGKPIQLLTPEQTDQIPENGWFCFEVHDLDHVERMAPPFVWEKVAVIPMARYAAQREAYVVIGRRTPVY